MEICCISDLHGFFPDVGSGDLLIVAGDLTATGKEAQYFDFFNWVYEQNYKKKIVVAGNHDTQMQKENYKGPQGVMKGAFDYLCDSGTEFEGLKIWGSPWTLKFEDMSPRCTAFTCRTEEGLAEKFQLIPEDTDILITHSPIYQILDRVFNDYRCGSMALKEKLSIIQKPPRLHVCGHIHEGYGQILPNKETGNPTHFVNCSIMNRQYQPVNKPIWVCL